jgi:hypothetical protein
MAQASHSDESRLELQRSERIVYDKANGEIVHVHQVLWRPDREPPAASVIDAEARRVAAQVSKRAEDALDVLPVKLETLEDDVAYAVDLRTKRLVKKAP